MSSFHAVYKRFRRWKELGAFEKIWIHVVNEYSDQQLINDVNWFKTLFIDSTMI
jgi:transposase